MNMQSKKDCWKVEAYYTQGLAHRLNLRRIHSRLRTSHLQKLDVPHIVSDEQGQP